MRTIVALLILATLAACGAPAAGARPLVGSVTLSHGLASNYGPLAPTDHFDFDERFYCTAFITGLREGTVISARWLYAEQLIKRTDFVVQKSGNGYVGFELTNDSPPWRAGTYRVEILVDHEAAGKASFRVP